MPSRCVGMHDNETLIFFWQESMLLCCSLPTCQKHKLIIKSAGLGEKEENGNLALHRKKSQPGCSKYRQEKPSILRF